MSASKLTPPMKFEGSNIEEIIKNGFKYFYDVFLKKDIKPLYKGKPIFFDMNTSMGMVELKYPERFMHICSIEDKEEYEIYPCNNDISYEICKSGCSKSKALTQFQFLGRIECAYRLSRIHWIPDIIRLANENDQNIESWVDVDRDKKGNKINYHHIRYNCGVDDFIIILKEDKVKGDKIYRFITAFPVFLKRNKKQFKTAFEKSQKK